MPYIVDCDCDKSNVSMRNSSEITAVLLKRLRHFFDKTLDCSCMCYCQTLARFKPEAFIEYLPFKCFSCCTSHLNAD